MSTARPMESGMEQSGAEELRERAGELGENIRGVGAAAVHTAQDQVDALRDTATQYMEQGRAKAMELEETLEQQIREQPVKSVLVAAGIGFALGFLLLRR